MLPRPSTLHRRPLQSLLSRHRRGLLCRQPLHRSLPAADVAVWHQHDRVRHFGSLRRSLPHGYRRLRPDAFRRGPDYPHGLLLHRHPRLGARQAPQPPHAGPVLPPPLGLRRLGAPALRRHDRAADTLPAHRRHGRRHHPRSSHQGADSPMGRRPAGLLGGTGLRQLRWHAWHRLGQRLPNAGFYDPRRRDLLRHRR